MKHTLLFTQIFFAVALTALVANNHRLVYKSHGELRGIVIDAENGKPLAHVPVVLVQGNTQKGGTYTDENGSYAVENLPVGTYELRVSYLGYNAVTIKNIVIIERAVTFQNVVMSRTTTMLESVVITAEPHLVEADRTSIGDSKTRTEIQQLATERNDPNDIIGTTAGVIYQDSEQAISVSGCRSSTNKYYVDGIPVRGSVSLPCSAVEQVTLITGGVPAKFANADGGIVDVKTRSTLNPVCSFPSTDVAGKKKMPPPTLDQVTQDEYKPVHENDYKRAFDEPLSTFSIDVDNASYSIVRRFLNANTMPTPDAVRIEELVNYFRYDYAEPNGEHPFSVATESAVCPWNEGHKLVKVAIKGKDVKHENIPPCNLVFLVDVSGSMSSYDKLPLVKTSLKYLVKALRPEDHVALVVYAGQAGVVLQPTSGADKQTINEAIDRLASGGSTAGGAGIQLAYDVARTNFKKDGNNRVILATDGDFNVGVSSEGELEKLIEKERQHGVFLTALGFGTGNYKDAKMETLADKGNGNYFYIDGESEGKKVFTENLAGTVYTIAKDVKLQIEFNPAKVKAYRLLGYENRTLQKEDFNDDVKDAGELGAGTSVTAFYEVIPFASDEEPLTALVDTLKYQTVSQSFCHIGSPEAMTVKLRYKQPQDSVSVKLEVALLDETQPFDLAS
ncbi:MAG TPA: von Willebrand factor type A domain-containing protein, partial [Chitinophagales bacterium]|nr:von Willebrand factor type A domain-containing protein [Chitinophagales bacterium]